MIHKIHTGNTLPSIQTASGPNTTPTLGIGYWIVGYMESLNNFNTVLYPQDTRNCTTCHAQNIPAATQATDYSTVPTAEACGACHDNVNFATGLNHSAANIVANDSQCTHLPWSDLDDRQWSAAGHRRARRFPRTSRRPSSSTSSTASPSRRPRGSIYPVVNFSVVDPTNGNAPYNILTAAPFAGTDPSTGKLGLRRRYRAPRDRHRLGHERLHQLGQRRDARHMGSADFPEPALRLRHRHARPGTDRSGCDGRVHHDLAHPAARIRRPPTARRPAARHARPSPTSASSSKDIRASS